MSALPRPDLATGPSRALNDALHDLHHHAGWPSLRTLARQTGVSHTTVSKVFSSPALPGWGTLELLVEAMHGDATQFHHLWLAASTPTDGTVPPALRIAGRKAELDVVRRHLESGTGLLLVTGEAGIGKTTLVAAARSTTQTLVPTGHCLPLSTQVPFLPIGDCLRGLLDTPAARLREVVAACPPYVAASLSALLPDATSSQEPAVGHGVDRQLLFASLVVALQAVQAGSRIALLLEDVHWADSSTLDFLEYLLGVDSTLAVLGTWRTEDAATPAATRDWFARLRRRSNVALLEVGAMALHETREQLAILGITEPDRVRAIYRRSEGQPLFTEQLAVHKDSDDVLPGALVDLLVGRLEGLGTESWALVRTLGVAERRLPLALVASAAGCRRDELTERVRDLQMRRLIRPSADDQVGLQHPLLGDAVRSRCVAGEAAAAHRSLAEVMAEWPHATPAEIARHWQGAGVVERELNWRIVAARASKALYDPVREAAHWRRVIEIWPPAIADAGQPPISRAEAWLAAIDAHRSALRYDTSARLTKEARTVLRNPGPQIEAELLSRLGGDVADRDGPDAGLTVLDQALALFDTLPDCDGKVRALHSKYFLLLAGGRLDEAKEVAVQGIEVAGSVGNTQMQRVLMTRLAWHQGVSGSISEAVATMERARSLQEPGSDLIGDLWEAVVWTDVLLVCGAGSAEVLSAGTATMHAAEERGYETYLALALRHNLALSLMRDGDVAGAAAILDPRTDGPVDLNRAISHLVRARLDMTRGDVASAARRAGVVWHQLSSTLATDLDSVVGFAEIDLWNHAPHTAWDRLRLALESNPVEVSGALALPTLVLAARALADLAATGSSDDAARRFLDQEVRAIDRTRPLQQHAARPAQIATLQAEQARLDRGDSVNQWTHAAGRWDLLSRPHDAAYCRWRAAQVALREGQGTIAARLLKRAATDAREHVPLSRAIAGTAAG